MNLAYFPGLQIESALSKEDALNFKPDSWPPAPDFPAVIDAYGNVVSRYGDVRWIFHLGLGTPSPFTLGMALVRGRKLVLRMRSYCVEL